MATYWDEGNGIEATFKEYRVRWHIKYKQRLIHDTKLDHLQNCECADSISSVSNTTIDEPCSNSESETEKKT